MFEGLKVNAAEPEDILSILDKGLKADSKTKVLENYSPKLHLY